MNDNSIIFPFGSIYVSEEVLTNYFACNLQACKGACCTKINSVGAPITDNELAQLKASTNTLAPLLPTAHRQSLEKLGPSERRDIRIFTQTHKPTGSCVFVKYEHDVALCAIQQHSAELGFVKPISCSLFPIRETRTHDGKILLYVEYWDECDPAFDRGDEEDIPLYVFLKNALVARFGNELWEAMHEFVRSGKLDELLGPEEDEDIAF